MLSANAIWAESGTWTSAATGSAINYATSAANGTSATDQNGAPMTIVYLTDLGFPKIGQNSTADDIAWLRNEGWQVIELNYANNAKAVSPNLNLDIMAINSALQSGSFCGCTCSAYRSYILMDGYRIRRDVAYYLDDPTVYNYPDVYKESKGDSLYLDLIYPANASATVPVVITFSYSNSFATNNGGTLANTNQHKRMFLPYFWGAFKDSFVEGASAVGMAWAVCDHPKYCDWGQGKYTGGANKSLGAIEVNPDAARKVKSAIRTVRGIGHELGLNGEVVVTGFSRGSTAAALAVGDGKIAEFEDATRGRYADESSDVQCAVLGPGMFDYEHALAASTEYSRMNTFVTANASATTWEQQGALATIKSKASAPTLFFHNTDDFYKDSDKDPQGLYATQAALMKAKLDALGVATELLTGYSSGHAVPQDIATLKMMYDFVLRHVTTVNGIGQIDAQKPSADATIDILGRKVSSEYKGFAINAGHVQVYRP